MNQNINQFEMVQGDVRNNFPIWENEGGAIALPEPEPFRRTPIFDEITLPARLRKEHRTKLGVWGIIRVLEGRVRYRVLSPISVTILDRILPGVVLPQQPHLLETIGHVRLQIDFYNRDPNPVP